MKIWVRHTVFTAIMLAGITGVLVLNHFRNSGSREFTCKGISVELLDSVRFLSEDELKERITARYGACIGRRIDSIALDRIESIILTDRTVRSCEAWITPDLILHIGVEQRYPIARFVTGDSGFYVDADGVFFPLHQSYTAPVPVICGNLRPDDTRWTRSVAGIADAFAKDEDWKGLVDSLWIDRRGDIRIRPEGSGVTYILGDPDGLGDKMDRMRIYRDSLSRNGIRYSTVNVKYNNSIICK